MRKVSHAEAVYWPVRIMTGQSTYLERSSLITLLGKVPSPKIILKALEEHYISESRYASYLSIIEDHEDGKYRTGY